nr:TIGR03089 family protein [Nanchangia anserum]
MAETSAPALTYYGDEGRIELGGPPLARWACKISGYLLTDLGMDAGARVAVRLGEHWRALAWGLGVIQAGGVLECGPDAELSDADIAVCASHADIEAASAAGVPDIVAQVMASLAFEWPGELPDGCDDAQAGVMTQPDALVAIPHPRADDSSPIVGITATLAQLCEPVPGIAAAEHVAWSTRGSAADLERAVRVWASHAHAVITTGPLSAQLLETEHAREYPGAARER